MPRFLLFALAGCLLAAAAHAQPADRHAERHAEPVRAERSRTFDVLHYRIALRFADDTRSMWGETTVTLTPFADGLRSVALDAETFTVDAVYDALGTPLGFTHAEGRLAIDLARPAAFADTLALTISYHVENLDIDPTRYGMSAGYDLGIDFKAATEDNPALVNTLSFPEGARHWFPSYDHPNDRATHETLLTVRPDWRALSNGRLVEVRTNADGTRTFHWSMEQPHPTYLYVAVAGPYVVLEDTHGDLPLAYWVYPEDVDDAPRSFHKTAEILGFFEELYGVDYPWVKYDQVTIPGIGGGAESTTATVLGQSTIHDERAEQDFSSHWLIAHEAAHHWWGNLVSYRDWSETWLSESFATYSEFRWAEHDLGPDEGALNLLGKKNAYLDEARTRFRRPLVYDRWQYPNHNFDRHTYQKGSVVLHMLRDRLGEAAFRRTLRQFLTRHAFEPVSTPDLMTAIKTATGQNLDGFFAQWVYSPGHPVFEVGYAWEESTGEVRVSVAQTQDTTGGVPAAFAVPVRFRLVTPTTDRVEEVWMDERAATFTFAADARPLLVRFDAGNALLKEWTFEKSADELRYQLVHDDAMGRMWAAGQLADHPADQANREALRAAAEGDAFWAVRREAVRTLAGWTRPQDRSFFEARAADAHSQVRAAAYEALGRYQTAELAAFLIAAIETDDSYVAQAAAIRALSRTGHPAAWPIIEGLLPMSSPRDVVARAAREALEARVE